MSVIKSLNISKNQYVKSQGDGSDNNVLACKHKNLTVSQRTYVTKDRQDDTRLCSPSQG